MSDTPKSILAELVLHLSHDAGVNGSKFTDQPVGRLSLAETPDALWKRVRNVQALALKSCPELEALTLLTDALAATTETVGNPPRPVGTMPLQTSGGSPWKKALDTLGYEPEMQRDIVLPALKRQLAAQGS